MKDLGEEGLAGNRSALGEKSLLGVPQRTVILEAELAGSGSWAGKAFESRAIWMMKVLSKPGKRGLEGFKCSFLLINHMQKGSSENTSWW